MANRRFYQFYQTLHYKPVQLDCSFTVAASDAGGLGQTGLVGGGIAQVYMHTSAPLSGSGNPNPAAGYIYVQLQDNYNGYYFGNCGFSGPLTGSAITIVTAASLTVGAVYTIVSVGTTTAAQWVAVGVPVGITAAAGVSFVASATAGLGSGTVKATAPSGVSHVELVGDPNTTITSQAATVLGSGSGAYLIYQVMGPTSSSVTTFIPKAPADGTVVKMSFVLSNSSLRIQGD